MSIFLSRLFRPLAIGAATAALGLGGVQAMEVPMNLHQVLLSALDDEYRAEATYQAVIDKHGEVRPFINIIQAEQRHSDMVAAELVRNGWEVPANPHLGKLEAPVGKLWGLTKASARKVSRRGNMVALVRSGDVRCREERTLAKHGNVLDARECCRGAVIRPFGTPPPGARRSASL